jgi:catalase
MVERRPSGNPVRALAQIAVIAAAAALIFAWTGGWLTPNRISGATMVDALQYNAGRIHAGFRRAHSKGICVAGHFESNGAGTALSRAALFPAGSIPLIGRFNTNGSDPTGHDSTAVFHGLGLRFQLPDGEEWRMAMDQTPIFVVSNPVDFDALQIASKPDAATGMPDPAKMKPFLATHPETQAFLDYMGKTPMPSSFASGTYHSIHAFRFVDDSGAERMVRWQFNPETPFTALDKNTLDSLPANFLFDDILARIKNGPVKWHLMVIPANPGDQTDNATVQWQGVHKSIDVGTMVLDQVATEWEGNCRDYNYDPLILPRGVEGSDDPLLPARSAAYSVSFRRRAIEGPRPDAITLADQAKGDQAKGGVK